MNLGVEPVSFYDCDLDGGTTDGTLMGNIRQAVRRSNSLLTPDQTTGRPLKGAGMDKEEKREEIEAECPNQQHRKNLILILIIAVSAFCLLFCIVAISIAITLNTQSTPKEAILRHPNKAIVPAGLAKNDLEEAEKRIKQYAKTYVRDAVRGAMSGDISGEMDQTLQSMYSVGELLINERIVMIPNGTRCSILKSSFSVCKVRIDNGPRTDKIYWVYKKHLVRSD
ncbi:hypothetical protein ACFL3F_03605 [Planctomycetota bacterium]